MIFTTGSPIFSTWSSYADPEEMHDRLTAAFGEALGSTVSILPHPLGVWSWDVVDGLSLDLSGSFVQRWQTYS
jgi:hypothetical protein